MNYDDLISAATDVGYLLLRNGAEIYRVEDSMQRIFRAYGVETGEVFAIPTCIFVTITTPEGKSITKIKRLYTRGTDLDKVDQANDLCRRICRSLGHTIRASSVPNQGTEIRIGLGQKKTLPE